MRGTLLQLDVPVILAGDYNVMPTELDVYAPERWVRTTRYSGLRYARRFGIWSSKAGRKRCDRFIPDQRIYTFWEYFRNAFAATPGCG